MGLVSRLRWIAVIAIGLSSWTSFTGLARADSLESRILRVDQVHDIISLNPSLAADVSSQIFIQMLFTGLVSYNNIDGYHPALAESWETNADATRYDFKIRDGLKWSDNTPITAATIAESFAHYAALPNKATYYDFSLAEITSFETPQGQFLRFDLPEPAPLFISFISQPNSVVLPMHLADQIDFDDDWTAEDMVNIMAYNGPYVIADMDDTLIRFRPNPHYTLSEFGNDGIDMTLLGDRAEQSALARFYGGEADFSHMRAAAQESFLQRLEPGTVHTLNNPNVEFLVFNTQRAPFQDPALRQAASYALSDPLPERFRDRNHLREHRALIPAGMADTFTAVFPDWTEEEPSDLLIEARRIMEEKGYGPDNPLRVEYSYNEAPVHERIALVTKASLARIYIDVQLRAQSWPNHFATMTEYHNFDIGRWGWSYDFPHPQSLLDSLHSRSEYNGGQYNNPAYDDLVDALSQTTDFDELNQISVAAQTQLLNDYAVVPYFSRTWFVLMKPGLRMESFSHYGNPWMHRITSEAWDDERG